MHIIINGSFSCVSTLRSAVTSDESGCSNARCVSAFSAEFKRRHCTYLKLEHLAAHASIDHNKDNPVLPAIVRDHERSTVLAGMNTPGRLSGFGIPYLQ